VEKRGEGEGRGREEKRACRVEGGEKRVIGEMVRKMMPIEMTGTVCVFGDSSNCRGWGVYRRRDWSEICCESVVRQDYRREGMFGETRLINAT
jgi:hypothetical protein